MKLNQLKKEALSSWETINLIHGTTGTNEAFKAEIRQYGDLRCKSTWERAGIALEAHWVIEGSQNRDLITYFCHPDTPIGLEYNTQVLDTVLVYPTALEQIKNGLERLYYDPLGPSDQQDALNFLLRLSGYRDLRMELPTLSRSQIAGRIAAVDSNLSPLA